MATVHEFPDLASRSWRMLREVLAEHYQAAGWSQPSIERMLVTVGAIYADGRDGPTFSQLQGLPTPEDGVQAINEWVRGLVLRFLAEIADRELKLIAHGID